MTPLPRTPLDEILAIPGNRPVFEDLQKLLAEKKAIAFVGAGASAGMYPLWGEFIGKLADFAVEKSKAEPKDCDRWKADRTSTPQQRVNTILRKLGEDYYRQFLRETFAPRYGGDGKRYTPTHAMLLRLPFRGYVTTNYDPALEFARMELRPGSLTTGTPTWQDDEEVHRWLTGDVFELAGACPILWLHGYWQRPAGIVLNAGEYATAYRPGLYRKTFQRLWEQDHLVFAGFGFNDPQFTFMVGEILRDIAGAHAEPRHIAILGLLLDEGGNLPDSEAIAEGRANMEADYHVRPLFYRVKPLPNGGQDHSDLFVLLEALVSAETRSTTVTASPPTASTVLPSRWVHETTNDDKFTGREDERIRLDRWVADPVVRAIGITAVGGTGKTALTGHWLKNTAGWRSRPFDGLFAWSFYQERDSRLFLYALLEWTHETFGTPKPDDQTDLVPAALKLLRTHTLVVVLDGLEVLQEGPEAARYGTFLDGSLREFLGGLCARQHESLAVLTSRFAFADLERHLGTAFRQLELPGLAPEQGAALLTELEVHGAEVDRADVSYRLEGHPLGLRVFAEAIPETRRDHPREFLDEAFRTGQLSSDSPLAGKVRRLLDFYEKKLPTNQVRLLGVVAIFRTPVSEETILRLARGIFGRKRKQPLPEDATLALELRKLHSRSILTREPIDGGHGYACHPILRDHFRSVLLGTGAATARRAAGLLQGQPSEEWPRSVKEIEPVLLAIELLLDAGEFPKADELYRSRLENGYAFLPIPAAHEGFRCTLGFVQDEPRRRQCEEQLSKTLLSFYLNWVGVFASYSGHYDLAAHFYAQSSAIDQESNDMEGLSIDLQNQADLSVSLGHLADAVTRATEALGLARKLGNEMEMCRSHAYRGWARSFSRQVRAAAEDFATANVLEEEASGSKELATIRGTQWAELLLRTGQLALAARRIAVNLRASEQRRWNEDIPKWHWLLGACALAEERFDDAEVELRQAEPVFHSGQMLFELARLHVTAGSVALARRDATTALHRAAEALALAQPRGMRLVHADALVLRGRARLLEAAPERALEDAEYALRLARDCGYAWAERDGLLLQADAHTALGHRDAAHRARSEADALAAKLRLTEEDLAEADAKAEAWLQKWERESKEKGDE